jgi:aminoglycoside phosphotransferase (APT) family kinase protein
MEVRELERYLSDRLGPLKVTALHRTFPGHSRETWIVDTADHGGLVMRVDHPGGPLVPVPMRVEYEVYERLWRSPVPVAEPLWYAENVDFAGGLPHMVRRLVDGSSKVAGLTLGSDAGGVTGADIRRSVCYEMAEKLALVHTLDWRSLGFDEVLFAPTCAADALREELQHWRTLWAEHRTDPFPMLTEALYWLEEQIPPGGDVLSLLKGNNGMGEEIWSDGRIVALSDWELAAIGDPALDWAFSQGLLSLHDVDDTLAHYAAATGFEIDRRRLAWSVVWIRIKASMTTNGGLAGFLDGRDRRLVRPALGIGVAKTTESWLADALGGNVEELGHQIMSRQRSPYVPASDSAAASHGGHS